MITNTVHKQFGEPRDAATIGKLILMQGVTYEDAAEVPSVELYETNANTFEQAIEEFKKEEDQKSKTSNHTDVHLTIVKDKQALEVLKNNLERMRSGLSSASKRDEVIVWVGRAPTLTQNQLPTTIAFQHAKALTVLPSMISRNFIRNHSNNPNDRRRSAMPSFVYPLDESTDCFYMKWWLWIFVFISVGILIIAFLVRLNNSNFPLVGAPHLNRQEYNSLMANKAK